MPKAQASAELVVVVSALMLVFLLVVVIKTSYEDLTRDYMERLEAERIAKRYATLIDYVALAGDGASAVVVNLESGYTITFNETVTVNGTRGIANVPMATRDVVAGQSIAGAGRVNITNSGGTVYITVSS